MWCHSHAVQKPLYRSVLISNEAHQSTSEKHKTYLTWRLKDMAFEEIDGVLPKRSEDF
jgi:hypothetical protein